VNESTFVPEIKLAANPFHHLLDHWPPLLPIIKEALGDEGLEQRDFRLLLQLQEQPHAQRLSWIRRGWNLGGLYAELSKFPLNALGSIRGRLCFRDAIIGPRLRGRQDFSRDRVFFLKRWNMLSFVPPAPRCPHILFVQRQSADITRYQDAGRTVLNMHEVNYDLRRVFKSDYMGSVALELTSLYQAVRLIRSVDIIVMMHGAGHTLVAIFKRDDTALVELSYRCRDTVLKNTGKVRTPRQIYRVVPDDSITLSPRAWLDQAHYLGSEVSGRPTAPECHKLFPKPFHRQYGDAQNGYFCGIHHLDNHDDSKYSDECRMNVILSPPYVTQVVIETVTTLPNHGCNHSTYARNIRSNSLKF
jgi:hypothetical protein